LIGLFRDLIGEEMNYSGVFAKKHLYMTSDIYFVPEGVADLADPRKIL
jgi:hypothetical protein